MTSPAPPHRRWFRFSLRTLFVLVALFGVVLGWLGVQVKWIRDRHEALAIYPRARFLSPPDTIPPAPLSLRILGEAGVPCVIVHRIGNKEHSQSEFERVGRLFPEAEVVLVPE